MKLLKFTEGEPSPFPELPSGIVYPTEVWKRFDHYLAWRWGARDVEWIVQPDEHYEWWRPHLHPVTITTTQRWIEGVWEDVTLDPTPDGGYELPTTYYHKFGGTAGDDSEVPDDVLLAALRLDDYWQTTDDKPGSSTHSVGLAELSESYNRNPNWIARAMQYSGAADLLRKYRKVP